MATNITTAFADIYLSSHLPEDIYIGTSKNSIEFSVYVDGDKVFSSVYYPYNQVICVRDIRSIVEQYMFEQDLNIATLTLEAKEQEGTSSVIDDVKVICSSFKSTLGSEAFLGQNFLTTRRSALVPKNESVKLYYFMKDGEEKGWSAEIYYSFPDAPDKIHKSTCNGQQVQSEGDAVNMDTVTKEFFEEVMWDTYDIHCVVVAVQYHVGSRSFNIFFTDEKPSDVFSFINAFNVPERMYLYGATTTKTEVNRSEAVIGRKTLFYDETVTVKHEVETAPMTYDEAMWLNQMFCSKWVNRPLPNNNYATVLISDITSEVTDSDKELMKLKFSWKYADGVEWI